MQPETAPWLEAACTCPFKWSGAMTYPELAYARGEARPEHGIHSTCHCHIPLTAHQACIALSVNAELCMRAAGHA